jgi:hypothetical protein
MKNIYESVTAFTPATRQIDFSNIAGFTVKRLLSVINITRNTPIYIVGRAGYGFASIAGNVLTLQYDTTTHQAGDILTVFYDDTDLSAKDSTLQSILNELRDDRQISETIWIDSTNSTYFIRRVTVNQDTGLPTVSFTDLAGNPASPTVANLVQVGSQTDSELVFTGYRAIANGTGFSTGDRIVEINVVDTKNYTIAATIWKNTTTGLLLAAAPAAASLLGDNEKVFADQLTQLQAINAKVPNLLNGRTPVDIVNNEQMVQLANVPVTTVNTNFASIDVRAYKEVVMVVTGTVASPIQAYPSLDGTALIGGQLALGRLDATTSASTLAAAQPGAYKVPVKSPFLIFRSGGTASSYNVTIFGIKEITSDAIIHAILANALPAGANTIGGVNQAGTWTVQIGNTPNTTPILASPRPGTTGGATPSRIKSAASVNNTLVKASAGNVFSLYVFNTSAALRYIKLYNKNTAPVAGTDIPVVTIPIRAGAERDILLNDFGGLFSSGIGYAITGGLADTDTTAVAVDDVTGVLYFA